MKLNKNTDLPEFLLLKMVKLIVNYWVWLLIGKNIFYIYPSYFIFLRDIDFVKDNLKLSEIMTTKLFTADEVYTSNIDIFINFKFFFFTRN